MDEEDCATQEDPFAGIGGELVVAPEQVYCRAGPINIAWTGAASAWDIHYDLTDDYYIGGWQDGCGKPRSAFFFDAMHDGADAWRDEHDYSMQPKEDECWVDGRRHVRFWESLTGDTHEDGACHQIGGSESPCVNACVETGYCDYTIGSAHEEDTHWHYWVSPHHHVTSWDTARDRLYDDFYGAWFVNSIDEIYLGNTYDDSGRADGILYLIELKY